MKRFAPALLALTLAAIPATAPAIGGTTAQTISAGLSFSLDSPTVLGDEINLELHGGYYWRDGLLFGGTVAYHDEDATTLWSVAALCQYHFLDAYLTDANGIASPFSPFAGLLLGFGSGENPVDDDAGALMGLRLGFDVFLTQNIAFYLLGDYTFATGDIYPDENKMESSELRVCAGLDFFF